MWFISIDLKRKPRILGLLDFVSCICLHYFVYSGYYETLHYVYSGLSDQRALFGFEDITRS